MTNQGRLGQTSSSTRMSTDEQLMRPLGGSTTVRGRRHVFLWLLLVLLAGVTGCGVATAANPFSSRSSGPREIEIVVESNAFNDVTIWAISQSQRLRLGRVSGMANARFTLDWDHVEQLSLRIDMLAGQSYTTPSVTVSAGERVILRVRDPLTGSIVTRASR